MKEYPESQYLGPRMTCRKIKNERLAMLVVGAVLATSTMLTSKLDRNYNCEFDSGYKQRKKGYAITSCLSGILVGAELALYQIYRRREQSWIGHDPTEGGYSQ